MAAKKKPAAEVRQILGATYTSESDSRELVLTHVGGDGKARFAVVSGGMARFVKLGWTRIVADGLRLVAMPDGSKPAR